VYENVGLVPLIAELQRRVADHQSKLYRQITHFKFLLDVHDCGNFCTCGAEFLLAEISVRPNAFLGLSLKTVIGLQIPVYL